jgi:hypothetical protein
MAVDWTQIRRRERQFILAFAAVLPGTLALGWPFYVALGSELPFFLAFAVFAGVAAVFGLRMWLTSCPVCRGMFFQRGLVATPFARSCGSCGVKREG